MHTQFNNVLEQTRILLTRTTRFTEKIHNALQIVIMHHHTNTYQLISP